MTNPPAGMNFFPCKFGNEEKTLKKTANLKAFAFLLADKFTGDVLVQLSYKKCIATHMCTVLILIIEYSEASLQTDSS